MSRYPDCLPIRLIEQSPSYHALRRDRPSSLFSVRSLLTPQKEPVQSPPRDDALTGDDYEISARQMDPPNRNGNRTPAGAFILPPPRFFRGPSCRAVYPLRL